MAKREEEEEDGSDKSASVASMVREALEKLGWKAKPDAYREYIMHTFGRDVPKNQISQYKSAEKRKKGMSKKRGKAVQAPASAPAPATHTESLLDHSTLIEFVTELRQWENRIGIPTIKELVAGLYKNS